VSTSGRLLLLGLVAVAVVSVLPFIGIERLPQMADMAVNPRSSPLPC